MVSHSTIANGPGRYPAAAALEAFRKQLLAFVEFTDEEWALFAEPLYLRRLKKKEPFVSAGKVCTEIGFVTEGSLRFFFVKDGVEISSYFCFNQELVTSYGSFLRKMPSTSSIEAIEDTTLVILSCDALKQLMANERLILKLERMGRLIAEYLICCYEERVSTFLTQSPEERYEHLIAHTPDLLQRIPQHQIAAYLGVTPVSLSRIRGRIARRQQDARVT
jgi:CRP-like cAMP-binding protein